MTFREVTPQDGKWARPLLDANGYKSCEFSFANIYMWSETFNTKIARFKDFVMARSEDDKLLYLYPAGTGDVKEAIDAILADAKEMGRPAKIYSLTQEAMEALKVQYPNKFHYEKPRGEADYIYLSEDLINLSGKKYQKKRNHCSAFERENPGWEFHEITADSIEAVCEFNKKWSRLEDNEGDAGIRQEYKAINCMICGQYDELELKGGYITVGGKIVAFSFGSVLSGDIFVTHVEKALYTVRGAYPMINREMARHFCKDYTYINRENDLDGEGLRTAKLSYHPAFLEEEYTAEWIGD